MAKIGQDDISKKIDIEAAHSIRLDMSISKRYIDIFDMLMLRHIENISFLASKYIIASGGVFLVFQQHLSFVNCLYVGHYCARNSSL